MSRLTAELLWEMTRVGKPAALGASVVVPLTRYDTETNKGTTSLHLVTDDGLRQLTADGRSPAISPDGRRVAFLRDVDGSAQLHVIPLDGGEAARVGDFPLGAGSPRWTFDGDGLICLAHTYVDAPGFEEAAAHRDVLLGRKVSAKVTEDRTYRFWDTWLTDDRTLHLFKVDVASRVVTDLTPDAWFRPHLPTSADPVEQIDVHPLTGTITFAAADLIRKWELRPQMQVWSIEADGRGLRCLTPNSPGDAIRPRFLADGTILFGETRELDYYATPVFLTVVDPATLEQHSLYENWELSPSEWVVDASNNSIMAIAEDRSRTSLFHIPQDGGDPSVLVASHSLSAPAPDALGSVYLVRTSISAPPDIVRVPTAGGKPEPVTSVNADLLAAVELGRVEERWFTGARGDDVQMFIVCPPEFTEDTTWPLLQLIHGGPHNSFADTWHWRWNYQAFAAPGHVVALVNFHGSSSFGHEFARCIQGAWGDLPTQDILAATDLLAAEPWIDEDRMAMAGGSYGGYLTAWLGTQTDRFKAAIAHAAVTNQGAMWATDSTYGLPRARGATLWEDPDAVARWSPSHHYADYVTPTLVVHGERDYRVPINQGLELYGVLKAKGVEARLVYYLDENHWILSPQNSIHWYGEVLGWLKRFIG